MFEPLESLLVEVRPCGTLRVDRHPLPLARLLTYLDPKLLADPLKPIVVLSNHGASYGSIVAVLDELGQGPERVGLA